MKHYQNEMDQLHFTPAQKAALEKNLLELAGKQTAKRRPRVGRTAIIAACLAATLVVGAGATGILKSASEAFSGVFGSSPSETEVIDKIGRPIGATDSGDGLTITADAILGDKYSLCVVYTVTADDPTLFDGLKANDNGFLPLLFQTADLDLGILGGTHGGSYFTDPVPGDGSIQYVQQLSNDRPLSSGTVAAATFGPLTFANGRDSYILADGTWKLKFALNYEDVSIALPSGQTFTQHGMNYTLNEISISPIGYTIQYTVDEEVQWSNAPSGKMDPADSTQVSRYLEDVKLVLTLTDGSVLELPHGGGTITPKDGYTSCIKNDLFDHIIPLEQMESLQVGDVLIPIS